MRCNHCGNNVFRSEGFYYLKAYDKESYCYICSRVVGHICKDCRFKGELPLALTVERPMIEVDVLDHHETESGVPVGVIGFQTSPQDFQEAEEVRKTADHGKNS